MVPPRSSEAMDDVEIIRLSSDHGQAFAALESAIFPDDPWSLPQIAEELAGPHGHYFGLSKDGALVGYAGFKGVFDADLMVIGVLPTERGQGLGQLLLRHVMVEAKRLGLEHMILEVRASNEAAIGLYRANGFESIGRVRNYYRAPVEDAETMRVLLDDASFS